MKPKYLFNNSDLKSLRQKLRKDMPTAEVILWSELQGRRLLDLKFRRQYGIGRYVVDFYCPKLKLVIEVDGDSHSTRKAERYDKRRQEYIESKGIKVYRCDNNVYTNLDGVIKGLAYEVEKLIGNT